MSSIPNTVIAFVNPDGRLSTPGLQLLEDMRNEMVELKAALAAVTAPTGGGTQDTEARAAIAALIAAAQ